MKRSMNTLRRLLALALVLVMVGSLFAGCNKKDADPTVPSETQGIEQTDAPTDAATEAPTEEPRCEALSNGGPDGRPRFEDEHNPRGMH